MGQVLFANAAAVVLGRLRTSIPTMTFVHDVPAVRPDTFVRIFRTGGPRTNRVVDGAQLTIEAWAPTAAEADTAAQAVRAHLNALPEQRSYLSQIYRVDELSGPAELPDINSGSARFTWTVIVLIRGT